MSFPTLDRQKQCSKLNEKITEMNKHQAVTRGHKTLGAMWLLELQLSHQSSLYLDSEVAPKSPTFHTANR